MKNKVFKFVTMCLASIMLLAAPAFANEGGVEELRPDKLHSDSITESKKPMARASINPRGTYFSVATVSLENPEPGVIGIMGDVICSEEVDKITMTLYLDVYKNGKWSQVDSWSSVTLNEVVAAEYFEYTDYTPGYSYRVRGNFAVYKGIHKETAKGQTDSLYCE